MTTLPPNPHCRLPAALPRALHSPPFLQESGYSPASSASFTDSNNNAVAAPNVSPPRFLHFRGHPARLLEWSLRTIGGRLRIRFGVVEVGELDLFALLSAIQLSVAAKDEVTRVIVAGPIGTLHQLFGSMLRNWIVRPIGLNDLEAPAAAPQPRAPPKP